MAFLDKNAWNKPSLKTSEVEVSELGGSVRIRELPAEYSAEVASNVKLTTEGREQVARVDTATMEKLQFAYGVIDEQGAPMFNENEVVDLQKKHGRAFRVVIQAIDDMSGLDKEAIEKAEARFPARGASESGKNVGAGASAGGS